MDIDRRLPKFIGDLKELLSTLLIYQNIIDIAMRMDSDKGTKKGNKGKTEFQTKIEEKQKENASPPRDPVNPAGVT